MHTSNVVAAWALTAHARLREGMRTIGLDDRELAALTLVATHDSCSVEWLRVRVGLTQSGTVRLVDRLSDRGLLRRGSSTGRGVPLHLTAHGERLLQQWHEKRESAVASLLAGLPTGQRPALVQAMATALLAEERDRSQADATCRTCTWPACEPDCPVDRSVPEPDATPAR